MLIILNLSNLPSKVVLPMWPYDTPQDPGTGAMLNGEADCPLRVRTDGGVRGDVAAAAANSAALAGASRRATNGLTVPCWAADGRMQQPQICLLRLRERDQ